MPLNGAGRLTLRSWHVCVLRWWKRYCDKYGIRETLQHTSYCRQRIDDSALFRQLLFTLLWRKMAFHVLMCKLLTCTGWPRLTSSMNSSARPIPRLRDGYVPLPHHRWLSVVHGCPPSAIGPFLLPLPVLGTVCLNTSRQSTLYVSFPRTPEGFPLQAFLSLNSLAQLL